MILTAQQLQAIDNGETIEVTIGSTPCVVVRQDVYQRTSPFAEPGPRETYPAVLKALDSCDVAPEQYLEYLNE